MNNYDFRYTTDGTFVTKMLFKKSVCPTAGAEQQSAGLASLSSTFPHLNLQGVRIEASRNVCFPQENICACVGRISSQNLAGEVIIFDEFFEN